LQADDADLGDSGKVRYSFDTLSTDVQYFTLDTNSGELNNARPMPTVQQEYFELVVNAYDVPTQGLSQSAKANVVVCSHSNRLYGVL
jgi:hypothetical protein